MGIHPDFWKEFPFQDHLQTKYNAQREPYTTAVTNLRMVNSGRIDVFPIDKRIGSFTTKKMKLANVTHSTGIEESALF
ncbi:hypothetical protein [Bdellovibrio sp. HCB288]|uniref:hypothetical protein n=1 Tax=Bdellovibrio sp. HCB288 TaxID=3394355 RepID=UPI0039B497AB